MSQFKPVIYVKTIDGSEQERVAHTPAAAVRYTFDGWVEKPRQAAKETAEQPARPAAQPGKN